MWEYGELPCLSVLSTCCCPFFSSLDDAPACGGGVYVTREWRQLQSGPGSVSASPEPLRPLQWGWEAQISLCWHQMHRTLPPCFPPQCPWVSSLLRVRAGLFSPWCRTHPHPHGTAGPPLFWTTSEKAASRPSAQIMCSEAFSLHFPHALLHTGTDNESC